jgi:hypothetical protein
LTAIVAKKKPTALPAALFTENAIVQLHTIRFVVLITARVVCPTGIEPVTLSLEG